MGMTKKNKLKRMCQGAGEKNVHLLQENWLGTQWMHLMMMKISFRSNLKTPFGILWY